MKLNLQVAGLLLVTCGLLSDTSLAADATIIQLGQNSNWNPPTSMSLQMLGSDQTTQTQVWAVAADSNICNVPHDPYTYTIVTFSANPQLLLDDIQTKKILDNAIALHTAKCSPSRFSIAVAVDKNISAIDLSFVTHALSAAQGNRVIDGVLAQSRSKGQNSIDYFNKVATQHQHAAAAAQENQRQEQIQRNADQTLQAFASRYGAIGWINWKSLMVNPFAAEGKVYLFNTDFTRMITPTSGIFSNQIVVSDIPRSTFTAPITPRAAPLGSVPRDPFAAQVTIILAGKVIGTTNIKNQFGGDISVPHVKYLGHVACNDTGCDSYLKAHLR